MATLKNTRRTSKYNPETIRVIVKFLREGLFREDSARLAGITPKTLYDWIKKYPGMLNTIEDAESWNKRHITKLIEKHAKRSWQAMAWLAERRHSEYSPKASLGLGAGNGVQIAIISGGYTPPTLQEKQPLQGIIEPSEAKQLDKPEAK